MERNSPNVSEEATDAIPKHERLRQHLSRELSHGRLCPGNALPTELELAVWAKMSRNTVRQALSELHRSGLLQSREPDARIVGDESRDQAAGCTSKPVSLRFISNRPSATAYDQSADFFKPPSGYMCTPAMPHFGSRAL